MKKKYRLPVRILLIFLCIAGFASVTRGETEKDIKNAKSNIAENQKKIDELEGIREQLKDEVEELQTEKAELSRYIEELDEKKAELEASIQELEQGIKDTEQKIEAAERNLQEAQNKLKQQKDAMELRIRLMYETSQESMLEILLQSESFADLLNKIEYVRSVNRFDREMLEVLKEQLQETADKEELLKSEKLLLEEQKNTLQSELAAVEELQRQKEEEISRFEEKIEEAGEERQKISEDVSKLNAAIREEEQRIARIEEELKKKEEEARKKALAQKKSYTAVSIGSLNLLWPVPSSSRITSEFGSREAPVAGASTSHKGIDIGAESGSDILAAETGTVVISEYSSSAGNYVMISHGGGIYTVYMHMNSIAVREDDEVKRGDVIGTVGSTGYSTGPHLHFGLRINGSYVDPLNYVSP